MTFAIGVLVLCVYHLVECTPPGPDPFIPGKGKAGQKAAWEEVASSLRTLRFLDEALSGEGVGEL